MIPVALVLGDVILLLFQGHTFEYITEIKQCYLTVDPARLH